MPKILGLNLVGVLVASVVFFLVGWVWYGMLFQDAYMASTGMTADQAESGFDVYMLGGFIITAMQVIGVGLVMKWKGASDLGGAVTTAVILWFFLALPFCHYGYLYSTDHNSMMLMVDASHLLVGWVASAIVLSFFK